MKKVFLFITILVVLSLACDLSVTITPPSGPAPLPTNTMIVATGVPTQIPASPTTIPATVAPSATATLPQPSFEGVEVSVDPLSIVLSPGLASGARGIQVPRAEGDNVSP